MESKKEISSCFHHCPFFTTSSLVMECGHPHWKDKDPNSSLIITQYNARHTVPDECPLRVEPLTTTYTLNLQDNA